ncbi:MAG: hypothetical protein IPK68_19650 [Bdellovibrionales bacterium]|nr:hypothetical protein [Bdellovibrionales bacterium]
MAKGETLVIGDPDCNPKLEISILLRNNLNIERLIAQLETIDTLSLHHSYENDDLQRLSFTGFIDQEKIEFAAYHLLPELDRWALIPHSGKVACKIFFS